LIATVTTLAWLVAPTPVLAQNAYITNFGDSSVSVIDTASNTVLATIKVGLAPVGAAVTSDGSRVYIANSVDNTISIIDAATNTVIDTISVSPEPAGVAVTPDGSKVYVTHFEIPGTVTVIDATTNTVAIPAIAVGDSPEGVRSRRTAVRSTWAMSLPTQCP
jgi:YVTN family beta-propeller protein